MMRFLRDNGLTLVLLGAFLASFVGMALSGWSVHNSELAEHGRPAIDVLAYIRTGGFGGSERSIGR